MLAMAHTETASRQASDGYTFVWRAFRETSSHASVAYPGLEASHLASFSRPQPIVGRALDASRDAAQPTPPSLSSSQSTPRYTLPAQDIRQFYPNVYMEPQHYWDATRHRQSPSHPHPTPLSSFMSGPYLPSVSPPGTALAMSESLLASLRALQSQFTAFQESLGDVKSDVQDALSQLHALRTAQNKTDKSIAELEGVIGVSSTGTASRGRGRRGRGRGRGSRAGTHTELTLEGTEAIVPEKTLIQSLASIQSGLEQLLAREICASQSHPSSSRQEATSPPHFPPSVNFTEQEASRTSSPSPSLVDPSRQYSTLQLTQSAPAISSTSQSESSSPPSSIAILTPEFGTSPPPLAAPGKEHTDVSIPACPPSPKFEPSCSLSHSQGHTPGFTLVDWNVDPATLGGYAGSPVEANDVGLTSGLPTPPSETFADDHVPRLVSRSTREHGAATDQTLISRTSLRWNLPVIPTPPSLTPEPSSGEDRGTLDGRGRGSARQRSSVAFSEPLSPLTPPLPSPSPAVGGLLSEEGSRDMGGQAAAHKDTEELTDSTEDARGTAVRGGDAIEGVRADVSMIDNERSCAGPQTDRAGVDESISVTNSAVANEDSSRVSQGPSVGQPNIKLPEHHPDANGIAPAYISTDGNDGFSSPWRRPLSTPATPSQYATPSDSSGPCPTQEENEVWSALMLDTSGMSTPLPDSASFPPHHPSRASSVHPHSLQQFSTSTSTYTNDSGIIHASSTLPLEPFAVDPSVLHGPTPTVLTHTPKSANVPPVSDESLSPLTSLDDTDVDCPHGRDAPRRRKKPRATAPADRPRGSSPRRRRSDPYHAPSSSRAATAENLNGRVVGGPSPSLDELVLLARRKSLKIHLRLPESVRGVKRKRGVVDGGGGDGEKAKRESGGADSRGERVRPGASVPVDYDAPREGQEEAVSTGVSANVPTPCRIGVVGSAPGTPMPIVSRLAPESSTSSGLVDNAGERPDVASCLPVSGKRTKKQSERGKEAHAARMASEHARARQKERKRTSKAKPNSLVKYHVRNGQIVALEPAPAPEPTPEPQSHVQAPVTPSVADPSVRSEEAAQESATGMCHWEGRENRAMKAPLSSPAISSHPSPHSARCVKLSPTKEEVWNTISRGGATWPELPSMFSHWDAQFIQCDNCDMWFHYGCVAVMRGDPRLEPEALFICATCHTQSARRQTLRNHDDTCARPDCPEPQVTDGAELYFVEKLVGRKKIEGYVFMWLAKWEGFPMTQASWIPKENVVGDGKRLFSAFLKDARGEGADLSQDVVLLKEALEAGWKGC